MKNLKFSRLFAAVTFVAILALAGCKNQPEESLPEGVSELSNDDAIVGKWTYTDTSWNAYGDYGCNILTNKIETASYNVHNGTIYIAKTSDDSGYLYYQFEQDISGYGPAPDYEPFTVNCKGKWCAVAFKELAEGSVKMCDAYKSYEFADSLENAVSLYTIANGWFGGINTVFKKVSE